jgi:hypothetical protein
MNHKYQLPSVCVCRYHSLVFSIISKSLSSRSFWFVSDGIELIDVAIDVVVFRLFILLNRLISEVLSANKVSIRTKIGFNIKTCEQRVGCWGWKVNFARVSLPKTEKVIKRNKQQREMIDR